MSPKKVSFGNVCIIYLYDANYERKGTWEEMPRDRKRFQDNIQRIEQKISHVFQQNHRQHIYSRLYTS